MPFPEHAMTAHVDLSLRQFTEAWRLMSADAPDAVGASGNGIEYVFSGLPIAFFNIAIVTGKDLSAEALSGSGQDACAFASGRDVPWMLIVTHEGLAPGVDAATALGACDLVPIMPLTGMLADVVTPAVAPPAGLGLNVPEDEVGCASTVDVNALAYGMDLEASRSLLGRPGFWKDHVLVIGTAEGAAASSTAVFSVDGYRYVALVATHPAFQRRGFASATMRHALEVAARTMGDQPTVLHATAAGRPVYERMGYEAISNHTVFMEKRFLEGH